MTPKSLLASLLIVLVVINPIYMFVVSGVGPPLINTLSFDPSAWTSIDTSSYSVKLVGEDIGELEGQDFAGWYTDTVIVDRDTNTIVIAWARLDVDQYGTDQIFLSFMKPVDIDGDGNPEAYRKIVKYVDSTTDLKSLDSLTIGMINGEKRVLLTWTYYDPTYKNNIKAAVYDLNGNLEWKERIADTTSYEEYSRSCYVNNYNNEEGGFLLVWYNSSDYNIYARWLYYDATNKWSLTDKFSIASTSLYYDKADQMLCINGKYKALIVFRKWDSTEKLPDLYAALVDTSNNVNEIKLYDYDGSEETVGVKGAYLNGEYLIPLLSGDYTKYQLVSETDESILVTKTLTSKGKHPYAIALNDRFVIAWIDMYYDSNGDPKVANVDPSTGYYYYKVIDTTTDYAEHPLISFGSTKLLYIWTSKPSTTDSTYDIKYAWIDLGSSPSSTPSISETGTLVSVSNDQVAHGIGVLGDAEFLVSYTDLSDGEEDLLGYVSLSDTEDVSTVNIYELPRDADSYKQLILNMIDTASSEIYIAVAFWDEGENPCSTQGTIAYELVKKKENYPSIDIKIIIDNTINNEPVKTCLAANDIDIIDDSSATDLHHIMHDKFMIVDGSKLIVSTVNFITSDFYKNNNTAIYIESKTLSYFYREEFLHMWNNGNGLFGTDKTEDHSFIAFINYSGRTIIFEGYFSPQYYGDRSRIPSEILGFLTRADHDIFFASYIFTTSYYVTPIYNALVDAYRAGKTVKGVFDELMNVDVPGRRLYWLIDNNVPIAIDNHEYKMHAKLCTIDNITAIIGSWNPTKSATTIHDENILVIRDPDPTNGLAKQITDYIASMYNGDNFVRYPYKYNPTHLVITKVMFYPDTSHQPDAEWVEIYNPTSREIDLSNYVIGDSENLLDGDDEGMYKFPSGASIPPGGYIVIAYDASVFYSKYGFYPDYEIVNELDSVPDLEPYNTNLFTGTWNLSDDGDEVILAEDQDGFLQVIDAVWYGSSQYMSTSIGQPNSAAPLDISGVSPGDGIVDKYLTGDSSYLDAITLADKYTLVTNPQPVPEPIIIVAIIAIVLVGYLIIRINKNSPSGSRKRSTTSK